MSVWLTDEQCADMVRRLSRFESPAQIAEVYGIHRRSVLKAIQRYKARKAVAL